MPCFEPPRQLAVKEADNDAEEKQEEDEVFDGPEPH